MLYFWPFVTVITSHSCNRTARLLSVIKIAMTMTSRKTEGWPNIVPRSEWGARPPKQPLEDMKAPAKYVFIHHAADDASCTDQASCMKQVRSYQNYHMDDPNHDWLDIGYSFVVGEDGNAYMARGWQAEGSHTKGYNAEGIGICVIGSYEGRVPNDAAQKTIKQLIQCGLDQGYISATYTLKGHRDVVDTECPGAQLYSLIQSWPHYASGKNTFTA